LKTILNIHHKTRLYLSSIYIRRGIYRSTDSLLPARRFLDAFLSKLLGLAFRREAKSKLFGFDSAGSLKGSSAAVVATQLAFLLSLLLALRMLRALRSHGRPNRGQEDHQDSCDVFDPPHR
jgi:hypothetical protein